MGHSYLSLVKWKWAGQGRPKRLWTQSRPAVLLGCESPGSCLSSVLLRRQRGMEGVHPLDHSEITSLSSGVQSVQHPTALCCCSSRYFLGNHREQSVMGWDSLIPEPGLSPLCFMG